MKFYPYYEQNDSQVLWEFLKEQQTARVITLAAQALSASNEALSSSASPAAEPFIQCGIFNPLILGAPDKNPDEWKFVFHFNRSDEQFKSMKANGCVKIVFDEILAVIPSYWVEEKYAGAATTYYRYAEFECSVQCIEEPREMVAKFEALMKHYQPEGKYEKLEADSPIYEKSFKMLGIAECTVTGKRTKWKLGQNRPVETRRRIIEQLRARGKGNDVRAAEQVARFL